MQSNAFSIELRISLFPLSLNDLVYVHVNVGVFTRTPLFIPYPVWCGWNSSADGWSNCRCLAVFPRHKGRTKLISILPFSQFLVALIINRGNVVREYMFIFGLGG
jgi:hypothetical protein